MEEGKKVSMNDKEYTTAGKQWKSTLHMSVEAEFEEDMYARTIRLRDKAFRRQERQVIEKKKRELSHCRAVPQLSKVTKRLIKRKFSSVPPLHRRLHEVIRDNQQECNKIKVETHKIEPEYTSSRQFSKSLFENWLKRNEKWEQNKISKQQALKQFISEFEDDWEEYTFRPEIRPCSYAVGDSQYQRSVQFQKRKERRLKERAAREEYAFQPVINKNILPKYPKLAKNSQNQAKKEIKLKKNTPCLSKKDTWNKELAKISKKTKKEQFQVVLIEDSSMFELVDKY